MVSQYNQSILYSTVILATNFVTCVGRTTTMTSFSNELSRKTHTKCRNFYLIMTYDKRITKPYLTSPVVAKKVQLSHT